MSFRSTLQVVLLLVLGFQLSLVLSKPAFHNQQVTKRLLTNTSDFQTNAQRLVAGLPPLPPKRRFSPTRVQLAARSGPSPTPYAGFIRIKDFAYPNTALGWISKTTSTGKIRLTTALPDRLPIGFTYFAPDRLFEMAITNDNVQWKYLGATGPTLSSSARTTNGLVRTNSATPNSGPQVVGHSAGSGASESYIWKFDPTTNEFSGVWSNSASSEVPVYFYMTEASGLKFFYISANPNLSSADGLSKVRFYLEV
ncbi:hypothetical protein BKA70DRAFT_1329826 [Coprinopsis sp. MPI-PUGE-AT-0042]|nr:hypothetical protein BKA70DRAFT_1329826 [Coprinopsis sp. MPI-PUGE-AT-0042]